MTKVIASKVRPGIRSIVLGRRRMPWCSRKSFKWPKIKENKIELQRKELNKGILLINLLIEVKLSMRRGWKSWKTIHTGAKRC